MNKITTTISETLLLASLVVLFAIPVIVYSGFIPKVQKTNVNFSASVKKNVLGATTVEKEVKYATEMLSQDMDLISTEELVKERNQYKLSIIAYDNNSDGQKYDVVRIINTSANALTFVFHVNGDETVDNMKLRIDDSSFDLANFADSQNFNTGVTLDSNEWVTIGIETTEKNSKPAEIVLTTDVFAK